MASTRVLADTWYASLFLDVGDQFAKVIREKYPAWLNRVADRSRIVRGLLLFWIGRHYELIVTSNGQRGSEALLVLQAWLGSKKPKVIVLEFIRQERSSYPLFIRIFYDLYFTFIRKPAVQRAMKAGQVLTAWERVYYAEVYGISIERFRLIPWYRKLEGDNLPSLHSKSPCMVLASGRAACDWETLFKAAENRGWELTVICGKRQLRHVRKLSRHGNARVLSEITLEEHQKYVESAALYVLCLKEKNISCGQIRIMNAIRAGTPIVCTRVKAIEDYVLDGETSIVVGEGDYLGLRGAVETLLKDADRRNTLARAAFDSAADQSREQYLEKVRALVLDNLSH